MREAIVNIQRLWEERNLKKRKVPIADLIALSGWGRCLSASTEEIALFENQILIYRCDLKTTCEL